MTTLFKYDAFISYSSKDIDIVRRLSIKLKNDGLNVWFDEWEIKPGDLISLKIEQGLEQSQMLILMMSQNAFDSDWVTLERHTAIFRDPTNAYRRFIPLRLDEAQITDTLKQFANIDWRKEAEEEYNKLLLLCRVVIKKSIDFEKQLDKYVYKIFEGHVLGVKRVSTTEDGKIAVSASDDNTIKLWDIETRKNLRTFYGHSDEVLAVAITKDGRKIISGSRDRTIRVWDVSSGKGRAISPGHTTPVHDIAISGDEKLAFAISEDGGIYIWDIQALVLKERIHTNQSGYSLALSKDCKTVISGGANGTIKVWEVKTGNCITSLHGHIGDVTRITLSDSNQIIASCESNATIKLWDYKTFKCQATIEGHTGNVTSVKITKDETRIISCSHDKTIRIWDIKSGRNVAILYGHLGFVNDVVLIDNGRQVVSASSDRTVHVWELPEIKKEAGLDQPAVRYTNAKVLFVGDSGVGKSGLVLRLVEDKFHPTISTDGSWATQMKLANLSMDNSLDKEIWLWDFAGQADYRLIHQLFMDETALAILVFNPQNENPFEGLAQWVFDLQRSARRPFKKILVAGRCDRGSVMVAKKNINNFLIEYDFCGYFETSALIGRGCSDLRQGIANSINWEDIPWTSSPIIFQLLKNEIIKLKDEGKTLLRVVELKQQLEMRIESAMFSIQELRAVIGLLAGPGIVWELKFGDFILLQPDKINSYAAAVIRKVRANENEMGIILEENIINGDLDYQDMIRLPTDEEQIVLRAMHLTFINYGLCLREQTEAGAVLVFPSYFKRDRLQLGGHPAILVTYLFFGSLDDIYSTLIVRLHHTNIFQKSHLWRFAAEFKTQFGQNIGIKMKKLFEGKAELEVYFDTAISDDLKVIFIKYIDDHLEKKKATNILRLRHYVCPHCLTPVENIGTAQKRKEERKKDILCGICENRVPLWDSIEEKLASDVFDETVYKLRETSLFNLDKQDNEFILLGHAMAIAAEAGFIFQPVYKNKRFDGAIESLINGNEYRKKKLYLQLRAYNYYETEGRLNKKNIFRIKTKNLIGHWSSEDYPIMLVTRTDDNQILWMDIVKYIQRMKKQVVAGDGKVIEVERRIDEIIFEGEPFTASNLVKLMR